MPILPVCAQTAVSCLALTWVGFTAQLQPPPLTEMPLSLTNYWFFDSDGNPVAWNGQANGEPDLYGNLYPTSASHEWQVAGCINAWTKLYIEPGEDEEPFDSYTTAVSFWWNGERHDLSCYDNFGDPDYRRPFFHERHGTWVIPVDVLTDEVVYGLVWDWSLDTAVIGEVDK